MPFDDIPKPWSFRMRLRKSIVAFVGSAALVVGALAGCSELSDLKDAVDELDEAINASANNHVPVTFDEWPSCSDPGAVAEFFGLTLDGLSPPNTKDVRCEPGYTLEVWFDYAIYYECDPAVSGAGFCDGETLGKLTDDMVRANLDHWHRLYSAIANASDDGVVYEAALVLPGVLGTSDPPPVLASSPEEDSIGNSLFASYLLDGEWVNIVAALTIGNSSSTDPKEHDDEWFMWSYSLSYYDAEAIPKEIVAEGWGP
ncbi:MAG: hypothetical protein FWH11_08450 [Micrococcales bacterium]|nr:hypothetical protein [Micrococcales bacterium]